MGFWISGLTYCSSVPLTRAEETGAVDPHDLVRQQEDLDLAHGRIGREIDGPDRAGLAARLGVHADRLVAPPGIDFIQVRPVPQEGVIDRRLLGPLALIEPSR